MGRNPYKERKYQIERMWEVHQEICRRVLLGQKNTEIAEDLNVTPQMVSYTRNSALVREKLDAMNAAADANTVDIAQRIKDLAPKALEVMSTLMDSEDTPSAVRIRTAMDLLDRAGHSAVKKIQTDTTTHITVEQLENLKRRGRELGLIVDITANQPKTLEA